MGYLAVHTVLATQMGTRWRRPATFEGGGNFWKSSHMEGAKSFLTTAALSGAMMSVVHQDKSVSLLPIYFLSASVVESRRPEDEEEEEEE